MGIVENINDCSQLVNDIEVNRERLLTLGEQFGINNPKVLDASRELDQLILCYYKHAMKKSP
jgi:hypothetical protein